MKIIKEGNVIATPVKWWVSHIVTCPKCDGIFSIEEKDWVTDFLNGEADVSCPTKNCATRIKITKAEIIAAANAAAVQNTEAFAALCAKTYD